MSSRFASWACALSLGLAIGLGAGAGGCQCAAFHLLDDDRCTGPGGPCANGGTCSEAESGNWYCVVASAGGDGAAGGDATSGDASGATDAGCVCAPLACQVAGCPGGGACMYTPVADGTACTDGDDCTLDGCVNGMCGVPYPDGDGDGYRAVACGGLAADCNDANPSVNPGANEGFATGDPLTCIDGIDNDCDGAADVGDPSCPPVCTAGCGGGGGCGNSCSCALCSADCGGFLCDNLTCTGGGTLCVIDCSDATSVCTDVDCEKGAVCRLFCGTSFCNADECGSGAWVDCGGGTFVCGIGCP